MLGVANCGKKCKKVPVPAKINMQVIHHSRCSLKTFKCKNSKSK